MDHPVSKLTRRSVLAVASAPLAASTFPLVVGCSRYGKSDNEVSEASV